MSGTMTVGDLRLNNTVFVPGIREIIISLGQLDKEGCTTTLSKGKWSVYNFDGEFFVYSFHTP